MKRKMLNLIRQIYKCLFLSACAANILKFQFLDNVISSIPVAKTAQDLGNGLHDTIEGLETYFSISTCCNRI